MATNFIVNGKAATTDAPPATPLLWVIREGLKLTGTKFGCGTGLCGACMVHIDGKRAYSCQTQVSEIAGKSVTTIEGLKSADGTLHKVQQDGMLALRLDDRLKFSLYCKFQCLCEWMSPIDAIACRGQHRFIILQKVM